MRVNKVQLIGNVGKDPDIRTIQSGMDDRKVANFTLATTEVYRTKQGEKKESTQWHRLVAFGKTAELVEKYVRKGTKVGIEGKLTYRTYEKDGETKYLTEIEVTSLLLLSSKQSSGSESAPQAHEAAQDHPGDYPEDDLPF